MDAWDTRTGDQRKGLQKTLTSNVRMNNVLMRLFDFNDPMRKNIGMDEFNTLDGKFL